LRPRLAIFISWSRSVGIFWTLRADDVSHQRTDIGVFGFILGRFLIKILLTFEDATQHFGNGQVADVHVLNVGQVDDIDTAGLHHFLVVDGVGLTPIEDAQPLQAAGFSS
jgi:hypothetical protein